MLLSVIHKTKHKKKKYQIVVPPSSKCMCLFQKPASEGMGDEGIAALPSRMGQMRSSYISKNARITDEGVTFTPSSRSAYVGHAGMHFNNGFGGDDDHRIAYALIKGCPQLGDIVLDTKEKGDIKVVECLLKAAGHKAIVNLVEFI